MSDNVGELLKQRGNQWGDAIGTHVRIAQVWSGILGHEVQAVEVALMMEGLKLVRASINPDDPDSFDDAQGYSRIAELIAGHRDSLNEEKPAPAVFTTVAATDATCVLCQHPESAHRDANGTLGACLAITREGPNDQHYCPCLYFKRHV